MKSIEEIRSNIEIVINRYNEKIYTENIFSVNGLMYIKPDILNRPIELNQDLDDTEYNNALSKIERYIPQNNKNKSANQMPQTPSFEQKNTDNLENDILDKCIIYDHKLNDFIKNTKLKIRSNKNEKNRQYLQKLKESGNKLSKQKYNVIDSNIKDSQTDRNLIEEKYKTNEYINIETLKNLYKKYDISDNIYKEDDFVKLNKDILNMFSILNIKPVDNSNLQKSTLQLDNFNAFYIKNRRNLTESTVLVNLDSINVRKIEIMRHFIARNDAFTKLKIRNKKLNDALIQLKKSMVILSTIDIDDHQNICLYLNDVYNGIYLLTYLKDIIENDSKIPNNIKENIIQDGTDLCARINNIIDTENRLYKEMNVSDMSTKYQEDKNILMYIYQIIHEGHVIYKVNPNIKDDVKIFKKHIESIKIFIRDVFMKGIISKIIVSNISNTNSNNINIMIDKILTYYQYYISYLLFKNNADDEHDTYVKRMYMVRFNTPDDKDESNKYTSQYICNLISNRSSNEKEKSDVLMEKFKEYTTSNFTAIIDMLQKYSTGNILSRLKTEIKEEDISCIYLYRKILELDVLSNILDKLGIKNNNDFNTHFYVNSNQFHIRGKYALKNINSKKSNNLSNLIIHTQQNKQNNLNNNLTIHMPNNMSGSTPSYNDYKLYIKILAMLDIEFICTTISQIIWGCGPQKSVIDINKYKYTILTCVDNNCKIEYDYKSAEDNFNAMNIEAKTGEISKGDLFIVWEFDLRENSLLMYTLPKGDKNNNIKSGGNIVKLIKKSAKKVKKSAKKSVKNLKKTAKKIAKIVKKPAKKSAKKISKKITKPTKKSAKKVNKSAKKPAKKVNKSTKKSVKKVKKSAKKPEKKVKKSTKKSAMKKKYN